MVPGGIRTGPLEATWRLIREANVELETREPWKLPPGDEVDGVLGDALEVLRIVAVLASPAIPAASQAIWRRLGLGRQAATPASLGSAEGWGGYPGGRPVEGGTAVPAAEARCFLVARTGPAMWTDSHCHPDDDEDPGGAG